MNNGFSIAEAATQNAMAQRRANIEASQSMTRESAEEFEAVFLNTMLQSMFTGLEEGGTWGNNEGSETWRGLLVEEYSKSIAASGGIGIADAVQSELIKLQELRG